LRGARVTPTRAHQRTHAEPDALALSQLLEHAILCAQPLISAHHDACVSEPGTRRERSFDGSLSEFEHEASVT
jgi:hypothetical protein